MRYRFRIAAIWAGCIVLLGVIVLTAYGGFLYVKANEAMEKMTEAPPPVTVPPVHAASVVPKETAPEEPERITLLLTGLDYRSNTGSMNTDVIMVAVLNLKNRSATVVSVPRDLQLSPDGLPSRKANFYYPYFYNQDRATAFEKTKDVFAQFLDIPIDRIVTINFRGFEKAVDLLGGLTIDVDMDMRYSDSADGTRINLKKGIQTLNGKQVLDFVRYRKSNMGTQESSDYERNMRQQQVLDQLLAKMKSLDGIWNAGRILETLGDQVKTDMTPEQVRYMMTALLGMERKNVRYIRLEGKWVSPYIQVREEALDEARKALKSA